VRCRGVSAKPEGTRLRTLHGSLADERPVFDREPFMETAKSDTSIVNDVLHLGSQSKLTPEQIAKAVAHHDRHHASSPREAAAVRPGAGKKNKAPQAK
jgi:hypothetical protein